MLIFNPCETSLNCIKSSDAQLKNKINQIEITYALANDIFVSFFDLSSSNGNPFLTEEYYLFKIKTANTRMVTVTIIDPTAWITFPFL